MGYKAAVQILQQADDLKAKVCRKCDLLNDADAWTDQQKLQTIYHQALVLDLEYALDKKIELDLWNIGFKNHIALLQELARDKKNPRRSDYQALLTWCLEAASGYYLTLLQELCTTFDIDLPFRRRGSVYGQISTGGGNEPINLPQSSSCLYICQYCLVHLGDIARYRNQRKQAENFYKQAVQVSPTSGHPYNQLALLEASQGNRLSTVYYYVRAIAVKNPFPASATNLLCTLSSLIDKESHYDVTVPTKMTANEFIQLFLYTQGLLQTATQLNHAEMAVKNLIGTMTALVATQSFTMDGLIKITIINLYALKHGSEALKTDELTEDERKVRELALELVAGSLSAFLVPVHTLKLDETLLDYYALPAVKLLLYFIRNEPELLRERVFASKLQIWPSLCKLLNNTQAYLKQLNANKYVTTPLPEDKCLQGFLPFSKSFKDFDFTDGIDDEKIERLLRVKRIHDFSLWLTEFDVDGTKLIIIKSDQIGGQLTFEPGCMQPDPTNALLEEMKSFNIIDSTLDGGKKKTTGPEKKGGILKPQGSLEKSREERELLSSTSSSVVDMPSDGSVTIISSANKNELKFKRPKQNVALQSIFKKMEMENKQVKFSMEDKEKSVKFETASNSKGAPANQQQQQQQQQFNALRTQSFNQNHPAFPHHPPPPLASMRNQPPPNFNLPPSFTSMPPPPLPKHINAAAGAPETFRSPAILAAEKVYGPPDKHLPQTYPTSELYSMNMWKHDELPPAPPPSWWQSTNNFIPTNQPPPPYQRPENFSMNYPSFSNNNMSYRPPGPMMSKPEYGKQLMNGQTAAPGGSGGEVFHSPWNNFSTGNFVGGDGTQQSISMRQAMLKEVGAPPPQTSGMGRMHNATTTSTMSGPPQSSPGYSLFNTNSWTPNLAGQLRNTKAPSTTNGGGGGNGGMAHIGQQSLFSGQGPQSLAQLLEQQNQLQKNDL